MRCDDHSAEFQHALAELVRELEANDYRDAAGVRVVQTTAFLSAKAIVQLSNVLTRPWWRS